MSSAFTFPTTARLTEDGNASRIAAKRGDIVAYPFECSNDIQHAGVLRDRFAALQL